MDNCYNEPHKWKYVVENRLIENELKDKDYLRSDSMRKCIVIMG